MLCRGTGEFPPRRTRLPRLRNGISVGGGWEEGGLGDTRSLPAMRCTHEYSANTLHCPAVTAPLPRLANSRPSHSWWRCVRKVAVRPRRLPRESLFYYKDGRRDLEIKHLTVAHSCTTEPDSWWRLSPSVYMEYISYVLEAWRVDWWVWMTGDGWRPAGNR
ncbi:hypothetical protein E2C01_017544 [Portunus trituberculatus]|uniref:Uncharacterized protein n=1 Tax=Portunus trituberculatus TaxID=210409 RepID=A0A5B7DTT0_PORTR|nr:hypothetical protein [Portunus trituberculatus]